MRGVLDTNAGEARGFVGEGIFDFFSARGVRLVGEDADFEEGVRVIGGGVCVGKLLEGGDDVFDGGGFVGDAQEFDGSWNEVFGEGGRVIGEDVDLADAVAVSGFGEGKGDGASGVDDAVCGAGLGAVEMAEGDVVNFCGEGGEGEFFASSDDDGSFGVGATNAGLDGAVAHGDDPCVRVFGGFEAEGFLSGGVVERCDAFEVGVGGRWQVGDVGDSEEGDGEDECLNGA